MTSFVLAVTTLLVAVPASAATVHEIEARWSEGTPTQVSSGDVVNAEWRVNVNDDAAAPSNEPVDDVTFTVTTVNGSFTTLPDACLVNDVTPASSVSADGATLVCNVGTRNQGSAIVVLTPIEADGPTNSQITATGTIDGQTAAVTPIDIVNEFGMDIRWGVGAAYGSMGPGYFEIGYEWTLSKAARSDSGPQTLTYDLTIASPQGGAISVAPQVCTPFDAGVAADGHPWSGGDHPATQMTSFVDSCTLVQTGPTAFQLTLSGIDYDPVNVPTRDSAGNVLPTDQVALASGSVHVRIATAGAGSATLTSNAPTYTSVSGLTAQDDPSNNSETKAWTPPGTYSSGWGRGYTGSGGTTWDDTYQVAAGTHVGQYMDTGWQRTSSRPDNYLVGMCAPFDTRYVIFESIVWGVPVGGVENAPFEYYTGTSPYLDPTSAGYDPNAFDCAPAAGWSTTPPVNPADVRAVRVVMTQGQAEAHVDDPSITPVIGLQIRPETPVGTQVWTFFSGIHDVPAPNTWTGPDYAGCITSTPGWRYPCTTGFRDVLRVSDASPALTKSVDRTVVTPGVPATYTLTYAANGAGQIPPTVDGFQIADTLPAGVTYVAGSATPEPQVSVNNAGQQVLTWNLDGVSTNTQHPLSYQAVADDSVEPGSVLTNTAVASYGGQTRAAAAQVTVSTSGYTEIGKTPVSPFIPNIDGDGVGAGAWTVTLRSFDPLPQAYTDTIDILPFIGDERGTDFAGDYALASVDEVPGATVYYTTEDPMTLSDDPDDTVNGAAGAPSAIWSTTFSADATAVRVVGPELAPGATQQFTVNIETDGANGGDVLVNRAQAITEHTELVMRTSAPLAVANYYSAALKKYVQDADGNWRDANDVTNYPAFDVGDTVRYRIEVENTGQGTLTNIVVSDDRQPELGGFEIDELAPGAVESHEYEITVGDSGDDSLVNTACAAADIPADSGIPPTINCDPAGFDVDGDPTHVKELVSATPIGGGQWELVYGIDVTNTSTHPTSYTLTDELHFTEQASITSATVTDSPEGITLAEPTWNGADVPTIAANVALPGSDDAGYAPHRFEVTVIAELPLHLEGAGGESDPTICPEEGSDTDQGFNNTSSLTDASGDREDDQACAPIPSLEIDKSLLGEPVKGTNGAWTVTYEITVTNDGAAAADYVLTDRLRYGVGIRVVEAAVTQTPEGVVPSEDWTGLGDQGATQNVVAAGVVDAGAVHTYRVAVRSTLDADAADSTTFACPGAGSGGAGGFANIAGIAHNDLVGTADACAAPARPGALTLPQTGGEADAGLIAGSLLLLVAGGVLLAVRRRRATLSA